MRLAALRGRDHALLTLAALVGVGLALFASSALAGHMHTYKDIHHGLGQDPGTAAHPFTTQASGGLANTCVAVASAGTHWYHSCGWYDHHHVYQTNFGYSASSAHIEGLSPIIDHHHHFPH